MTRPVPSEMMQARLYLGHGLDELRVSHHNGPGARVALWVQGCRLRCTARCLNPHLLAPPTTAGVAVGEILARLRQVCREWGDLVEGISLLGGEPSEQPVGLAALLAGARASGLTTMVYTGHVLEDLRGEAVHDAWLRHTDLLVDGPFVDEAYAPDLAWRGSTNQRLLPLSSAYDEASMERAFREQGKGWSLYVGRGRVSVSGLQERTQAGEIERLVRRLRES